MKVLIFCSCLFLCSCFVEPRSTENNKFQVDKSNVDNNSTEIVTVDTSSVEVTESVESQSEVKKEVTSHNVSIELMEKLSEIDKNECIYWLDYENISYEFLDYRSYDAISIKFKDKTIFATYKENGNNLFIECEINYSSDFKLLESEIKKTYSYDKTFKNDVLDSDLYLSEKYRASLQRKNKYYPYSIEINKVRF